MDALAPIIENATALLNGLKDFDGSISAKADNGVCIALKLETASADDAAKLVDFVNQNVAPMKMMMMMAAAQDPNAKPMADALNALSVEADGATVSAKLTIPGDTFKKVSEQALD